MHGFPSTLQSLRGILKRKKRSVASNGKYSVASNRKRGRERGSATTRGHPKVKLAKQSTAKNSDYKFSSTFRRELITHAERRNILPQRILMQTPNFMHANRNEAYKRAPQDPNHGIRLQTNPKNYQDSEVGWGNFRADDSSKSTILNDTSTASQPISVPESRSINVSADRLHRSLSNNTPRDPSNLLSTSREIDDTASAAVANDFDGISSTNANGHYRDDAKISRAVLTASRHENSDSTTPEHPEHGGNSYPAMSAENSTYLSDTNANTSRNAITRPVIAQQRRDGRNPVPHDASDVRVTVNQMLIAEEHKHENITIEPNTGRLHKSAAELHQPGKVVKEGTGLTNHETRNRNPRTTTTGTNQKLDVIHSEDADDTLHIEDELGHPLYGTRQVNLDLTSSEEQSNESDGGSQIDQDLMRLLDEM